MTGLLLYAADLKAGIILIFSLSFVIYLLIRRHVEYMERKKGKVSALDQAILLGLGGFTTTLVVLIAFWSIIQSVE